jgi:excisionase family DNA binding protein
MTRRNRVSTDRDIEAAGFGRVRARRHRSGVPKYHAIKSVAEVLEVSSRTVRRWIESGDLVVHRVGRIVRIAEDDLRAFLALHRES